MNAFKMLGLIVILAGCGTVEKGKFDSNSIDEDEWRHGEECSVHHRSLVVAVEPQFVGNRCYAERGEFIDALRKCFPFASTEAGTLEEGKNHWRAHYCPDCRRAEQEWYEEHGFKPDEREILRRFIDGKSIEKAGAEMGLEPERAHNRFERGLDQMRWLLERDGTWNSQARESERPLIAGSTSRTLVSLFHPSREDAKGERRAQAGQLLEAEELPNGCPLHHEPLRIAKQPLFVGTINWGSEHDSYLEAQTRLFPYASLDKYFLVLENQTNWRASYCASCRMAEREWQEEHAMKPVEREIMRRFLEGKSVEKAGAEMRLDPDMAHICFASAVGRMLWLAERAAEQAKQDASR
jgi:thiol-disulfide isomerase/thioredoxin